MIFPRFALKIENTNTGENFVVDIELFPVTEIEGNQIVTRIEPKIDPLAYQNAMTWILEQYREFR